MKVATDQTRNGIQLTPWTQLEGLDFADDSELISYNQQQLEETTNRVPKISAQDGLQVNKGKTKLLKINTSNTNVTTLKGNKLDGVDTFTYIASVIDRAGSVEAHITVRTGKATVAFLRLRNIRKHNKT